MARTRELLAIADILGTPPAIERLDSGIRFFGGGGRSVFCHSEKRRQGGGFGIDADHPSILTISPAHSGVADTKAIQARPPRVT